VFYSGYLDRLPFVFVIGIATSMEAVYQLLPRSALGLLRTEKFRLQRADECVNTIVRQASIDDSMNIIQLIYLFSYLLNMILVYILMTRHLIYY
jgi:hypothetical protein